MIFQLIPGIYEGLFRRFQNIEIYIVYCVLCYSLKNNQHYFEGALWNICAVLEAGLEHIFYMLIQATERDMTRSVFISRYNLLTNGQ